VTFNSPNGSDFSYATSFPTPILMGAAFDDALIYAVASTVGKEARAFGNYAQSGYDFWYVMPTGNRHGPLLMPFQDAQHQHVLGS
jgi:beta-glucosidase-like glycosyl hydrolase